MCITWLKSCVLLFEFIFCWNNHRQYLHITKSFSSTLTLLAGKQRVIFYGKWHTKNRPVSGTHTRRSLRADLAYVGN